MDPVLRRGDVSGGFQQTAKTARFFRVLLAAALLFLTAGGVTAPAFATDYYVATTGNDSNPGTLASPFRTIARGSQALASGDTLLIRAGTYNENMIHGVYGFTMPNGTAGAMTRFAAYPGEQVIVKPPVRAQGQPNFVVWFSRRTEYIEVSGLILDGTNGEIVGDPQDIAYPVVKFDGSYEQSLWAKNNRLIGNELRFGGSGISGGGGNQIIGNRIHHNRVYGIYTGFDNGLIEGNIIHDNAGYGLHLYTQDHPMNGWVVRNNSFYGNGDNYYPKYPPYNGVNKRYNEGVILTRGSNQFYNNIVYNHAHGGVRVWGNADRTLVANNTVYGNGDYGIKVDGASNENNRIINNISWGNSGPQITNTGTGTVLQNNLTTDPGVVNAAGGDFHLNAGSPAIDAGRTMSEYSNDFDYGPRPWPAGGAYDIGAFEFGSPPGTRPAPPPFSGGGGSSTPPGIGGGMCTIVTTEDVLCAPMGATVPLNIEIETFTNGGDNNSGHGNDTDGDDDDNTGGDD